MLRKIILIMLCAIFSINSYALESFYDQELPLIWSSIITLSGGVGWGQPGQNQFLYPNRLGNPLYPLTVEEYRYQSKSGLIGTGEIFFGLQHLINPYFTGELGLGVAGGSNAEAKGIININYNPHVNTFAYQVNHARIELKGKIISNCWLMVQPYIGGSFGVGFNHSHSYTSATVNNFYFPTILFEENTNYGFTYSLGLGIQTKINRHWQIGVGYELVDWGKNFLGANDLGFNGPGLSRLYVNEILFSLSYLYS